MGWRTVCAVERDAYAAQILAQRQTDGLLPTFPIWSDVCSFDGRRWRGIIDVVSGGFPCQDISAAGNGTGINGARSGLWREMARIISEVRPELVYLENSPLLVGRGLALVLGELAEMGYDAQWCIVSASDVGAPHKRDRTWLVAYSNEIGRSGRHWESRTKRWVKPENCSRTDLADAGSKYGERFVACRSDAQVRCRPLERSTGPCGNGFRRWPAEPGMGRVADGVAHRMDRLKALGNGQVPRVAARAFDLLYPDRK
nr:DNA cytosine methyltransferase [Pseudomonas sp. TH03]